MTDQNNRSLGIRLAPLLAGGFFRPLSRPSAAIYMDCAERLMEASDEGGQIDYSDARSLIREVLLEHPDLQLEEDEGGGFKDLYQRAGHFFNRLIESHWIQERRIDLDKHYVLISPGLRRLLHLLRDLAEDRPAELKDFTTTLRSLCNDLLRDRALDPSRLGPEEMRQTVKDLLARAQQAEEQMHAVEILILQQEGLQRASHSAQETLQRFLVDFHAGEHMVCYDALQEGGLITRLTQARSITQEAANDPFAKQRLAEGLAKHHQIENELAYIESERWFIKLDRLLAGIPIKQRLIDGRMSDFSRLSAARYRYQTEMRSRFPEQVKSYLEEASELHQGKSFAELASELGMPLLSPWVRLYYGQDSLARPRRQKGSIDLSLSFNTQTGDAIKAQEEIRRRNLNILTPQRAARFIEKHLPEKGNQLSTETLHLHIEDDMLDLLATLAFDHGPSAVSSREVRWKVRPARADFAMNPEEIPRDPEADRLMERLTLERTA